jgi:thiamine biosynthesis lipoprotein
VFTSGNYERYFTWQGKRFHHIIDPRTGYPAEGTRSVTVIDSDATRADAAATALFIAGPDGWFKIARQMGIEQVLLFDDQDRIHMTPAMAARVELEAPADAVHISPPIDTGR